MEWVETTAKTVDEAKELALDKLGVDDSEAEFEVIEEPRQGLFGRTRGLARVRGRIQPKTPRAKEDGRDRKRRRGKAPSNSNRGSGQNDNGTTRKAEANNATVDADSEGSDRADGGGRSRKRQSGGSSDASNRTKSQSPRRTKPADRPKKDDSPMEDVQTCVEEFLTGLTSAFGIDADVVLVTDDEQIMATIEGKHGLLLGPKARTLDAIQELTRVTAQRSAPSSIRIKVDVGGYREARREALGKFAQQAADKAVAEGIEVVLEPMNSADRKVVHDALNDVAGVSTRSAGNDPRRFVVVVPDAQANADDAEDDSADA